MKAEEVIDLSDVIHTKEMAKLASAETFVSGFYDDFLKLVGTRKGRIVDISDADSRPWPSAEEYKRMTSDEKRTIYGRFRNIIRAICHEIARRGNKDTKWKYLPTASYVGNGRVVLYWYLRRRTKKDVPKSELNS